ncbi:hypothetical protein N431DRAFT_429974 [Stipitochalara longipes BDJ]|nr:hypothetical protein N431DRAFT_429974 [Stipitochalara longipes BDJ]
MTGAVYLYACALAFASSAERIVSMVWLSLGLEYRPMHSGSTICNQHLKPCRMAIERRNRFLSKQNNEGTIQRNTTAK